MLSWCKPCPTQCRSFGTSIEGADFILYRTARTGLDGNFTAGNGPGLPHYLQVLNIERHGQLSSRLNSQLKMLWRKCLFKHSCP